MAEAAATMNGTIPLADALLALREFFDARSWKYCIIGGIAAIRWGEPRLTQDVDVVVLTEFGNELPVVDELLATFPARLPTAEARQFALDNRVLLLQSHGGVPIDVSLGALPFEEQVLVRAHLLPILPDQIFPVASPEDVIVMKTVAGRPQDWRDIEGVIARQESKLDWRYIHAWLDPLLETLEVPERAAELDALRQRIETNVSQQKKQTKKRKPGSKKRDSR
jgi:hypothetical protein